MSMLKRSFTGTLVAMCLCPFIATFAAEPESDTSGSTTAGVQGLTRNPPDSAKFITKDAERDGDSDLADFFRLRPDLAGPD